MTQKETDARIIIDRKLKEVGWDIENKRQVDTEKATTDGRADYVLKDSRGRPLAVIEAKKFSIEPSTAKSQAENYAKELGVDFIFLSNGEIIYFWDYNFAPERLIDAFFSRADLVIKNENIKQKQSKSKEKIDHVFDALMYRAFNGGLA